MTFKDDITTDLSTFLDSNEFAISITYGSTTIKGIFDNSFEAIDLDENSVENTQPQVIVRTSDITGLKQGDIFIINSISYNVTGIHADGTGLTTVLLSQD